MFDVQQAYPNILKQLNIDVNSQYLKRFIQLKLSNPAAVPIHVPAYDVTINNNENGSDDDDAFN